MSSIEVLRTHRTAMATASRFAVSWFMGTLLKSENHDGSSMVFLASSNHQACVGLLGDEAQDGHHTKAIGRRVNEKKWQRDRDSGAIFTNLQIHVEPLPERMRERRGGKQPRRFRGEGC